MTSQSYPSFGEAAGAALDALRTAARDNLRAISGEANPRWRVVFTDSEAPTGIGPVCPDPGHDAEDGSAYDCCPEPVIETRSAPVAAYFVALLNADKEATG